MHKIIFGVLGFIGFVLFVTIFFGSWYTVDETQRGVLLQNGAIASNDPIGPGLHFKAPIIQDVDFINVQAQKSVFENLSAGSSDLQQAQVRISVNWRIPEAEVVTVRRVYFNEANLVDRALYPKVFEITKSVFSKYRAELMVTQREKLTADIVAALDSAITAPIIIDSVQVEDVQLSAEFMKNIEDKANQTLKVETLKQLEQQAIVQARTTVVNAQAEADARLAQATADAEAIRVKGNAEADAINARGKALRENPNVVALVQAEKWNGQLPTTMVPNATIPFLDVKGNVNPVAP